MSALLAKLTPRELEVVQLVVYEQASNQRAADTLGISLKTLQTHRTKIRDKLGVHNTAQLMARVHLERGSSPASAAPLVLSYSAPRVTMPLRPRVKTSPRKDNDASPPPGGATERDVLDKLSSEGHVTTVAALAGVDELAARRVLIALGRVREAFSDAPPPPPAPPSSTRFREPEPEPESEPEPEPETEPPDVDGRSLADTVAAAKRERILTALEENGGNVSASARELGVHRQSLQRTLRTLEPPLKDDEEPAPDTERSPAMMTMPSPVRLERRREPRAKHNGYFNEAMLREIHTEARRLNRSISWVIQRAYRLARKKIRALSPPPRIEPVE